VKFHSNPNLVRICWKNDDFALGGFKGPNGRSRVTLGFGEERIEKECLKG
jgi:hypothetical protein